VVTAFGSWLRLK